MTTKKKTTNKPQRAKSGKVKENEAIQTKSPKEKALPKKRKSKSGPSKAAGKVKKPIVATKKNKGGRPTRYKAEYAEQTKILCRLGAIDKDLAKFFKVNQDTINEWKKKHPKFSESLKEYKKYADEEVKRSLFERATGYSHPDLHISSHQGKVTKTEITKHYPPETVAAIFWLKNRDPENWRDKLDHDISGSIIIKTDSDDDEL